MLAGPVRVGRALVSTVRGVRVVCTALVVPMTPTESGAVATLPSLRRPVCACECLNIADVRADSYGRGAGGGACTAWLGAHTVADRRRSRSLWLCSRPPGSFSSRRDCVWEHQVSTHALRSVLAHAAGFVVLHRGVSTVWPFQWRVSWVGRL